jgi:hypothetical protein
MGDTILSEMIPLVPPLDASAEVATGPAFVHTRVPVPSGVVPPGVVFQDGAVVPEIPVVVDTSTLPLESTIWSVVEA